MKRLSIIVMYLLYTTLLNAQDSNYKVVFDMTSKDTMNQQSLIRELKIISQSSPASRLEVVTYGEGLNMLVNVGYTGSGEFGVFCL